MIGLRILFGTVVLMIAARAFGADAAVLQDCRLPGISTLVKCGSVLRPLNPAQPNGKKISVGYAVLEAKARRKLPDPVFFFAGGPGQSATGLADKVAGMLSRLNFRRDIVLVDQRGTGRTLPMHCREVKEALADAPETPEQVVPLLRACRARLVSEHGLAAETDLAFVNTTLAMQDVDVVRSSLGAAQINLVGVSYGTRAALEYARLFPQQVRRVVLDGVAPADMGLIDTMGVDNQAALDAVFAACRGEPACAQQGDLDKDWQALIASLPQSIRMPDPQTGVATQVHLTRWMVESAVSPVLYQPALASALPVAIRRARAGDFAALAGLASRGELPEDESLAMGMHFGVVCAEDFPRMNPDLGSGYGSGNRRLYAAVCKEWPVLVVDPAYYTLPHLVAPALLLGGGSDPVTPPRHMERVATALGKNALALTAPNLGHNVAGLSPCARDLVHGFINAVDAVAAMKLDAECLKTMPRPPAFVPYARNRKGAP